MEISVELHFIKGVMFGIEWSSRNDNEGDCGFVVLDIGIVRFLVCYA
jgi:hypothetical protein